MARLGAVNRFFASLFLVLSLLSVGAQARPEARHDRAEMISGEVYRFNRALRDIEQRETGEIAPKYSRDEFVAAKTRLAQFNGCPSGFCPGNVLGSTGGWSAGLSAAPFGDSRTIQGLIASAQNYTNRSYVDWARLYSNQAFDAPGSLNFGVSGNTSTQMLARLSTVTASSGNFVPFMMPFPNDVGVISTATSISNGDAIIAGLVAARKKVVLIIGTPRTDLAGQNLTDYLAVRDWARTQAGRFGVVMADAWDSLATSASGFTLADPTMVVADGIHLSVRGSRVLGQVVATAILTFTPTRDILPTDNTVWSSGPSLGVNLVTNSQMTGGATVATNWSVSNNAGGTAAVVSSKSTLAGGVYAAQQMVISGTPSGAGELFFRLEQNLDTQVAAIASGNAAELGCAIEVDSGAAGVRSVELFLATNINLIDSQYDSGDVVAAYQLDGTAYSGVLRTLPYTFLTTPSATMRFRLRVVGITGVAMAATVRAGRCYMKRVS